MGQPTKPCHAVIDDKDFGGGRCAAAVTCRSPRRAFCNLSRERRNKQEGKRAGKDGEGGRKGKEKREGAGEASSRSWRVAGFFGCCFAVFPLSLSLSLSLREGETDQ